MWAWSIVGYRHAETLSSTSLHVSAKIHAFFLASWDLGFGMALRRAVKSPPYLVGVVGGRRGIHMRLTRYSVCSIRVALQRHPMTK